MFAPPKKKKAEYNYYCGSCGCKYLNKPGPTRSACDSNCYACGSSRICACEWATENKKKG